LCFRDDETVARRTRVARQAEAARKAGLKVIQPGR
jgi:hypothetical protein